MSTLPSTEKRKQPQSIYSVMLFLSMLFMLIAVIAMFVELSRWFPELWNTRSGQPAAAIVQPDFTQFA